MESPSDGLIKNLGYHYPLIPCFLLDPMTKTFLIRNRGSRKKFNSIPTGLGFEVAPQHAKVLLTARSELMNTYHKTPWLPSSYRISNTDRKVTFKTCLFVITLPTGSGSATLKWALMESPSEELITNSDYRDPLISRIYRSTDLTVYRSDIKPYCHRLYTILTYIFLKHMFD